MEAVGPTDEYRERWQYVRHAENVRYSMVRWYFAVVGGVAAFGVTRRTDLESLAGMVPLTLFLALFSAVIAVFLVSHKAAYQEYVDAVLEDQPSEDPFGRLFKGLTLVGGGCTGAFFYFLVPDLPGVGPAGRWAAALVSVVVFSAFFWSYYDRHDFGDPVKVRGPSPGEDG